MSQAFQPLDPVLDLLGGENIVAHRPSFARAFGGACVGLLLSQFWFYSRMDTAKARGGSFYASQEQIEEETGLTRTEQETARRKMREAGILIEKKAGIPARLYYSLDKERIAMQLRQWLIEEEARQKVKAEEKKAKAETRRGAASGDADLFAENLQTSAGKTLRQGCGKPPNKRAEKVRAIPKTSLRNTKNTPDTPAAAPDDFSSSQEQKELEYDPAELEYDPAELEYDPAEPEYDPAEPEYDPALLSQARKEYRRAGVLMTTDMVRAKAAELRAEKGGGG